MKLSEKIFFAGLAIELAILIVSIIFAYAVHNFDVALILIGCAAIWFLPWAFAKTIAEDLEDIDK